MTVNIERLHVPRVIVRADIARFLPSAILAGYGVFILSLFARREMTLYINPTYVWPTTLAGALLLGFAAVGIGRRTRATCDCDSCEDGTDCGCSSSPVHVWPYLALCIPLLLAILVPPHALQAFSARQRGVQVAGMTNIRGAAGVKRVSLSVDTRTFSLQDWVGALSADPNPRDYAGKPIHLTGIVIHSPASVPPGYVMVLRYQVTCCIADARPEGLAVRDTSNGALKDNQWVQVNGTMGAVNYQGQQMAVVKPLTMTPTKAGDPYMY